MSNFPRVSGASLAAAAALLFVAGPGQAADNDKGAQQADVKCYGINACKGQSACATAESSCQGQNSCKGKGWIKSSKADCEAKGGEIRS